MIRFREETPADYDAIRAVTLNAFGNSEFGHNGESELIDALRSQCDSILSLVACLDSEIVGHILFTPAIIRTSSEEIVGVGLAPLSVRVDHQREGIGSMLVTDGLQRLRRDHCPFVVVLGHPEYYQRFGFCLGSQHRISHGFAGIPQGVFLVQSLSERPISCLEGGNAYYHSMFGPQFK